MAKRKKKVTKTAAKRGGAMRTAQSAIARIEAELPKTLRDYVKQVERRLNRLEKRLEKAGTSARKQATKLIRDASKQIGSLEARGEAAWTRLTAGYRKDAAALLDRLEGAIAPPKPVRKKKTARKKKVAKKA